MKKMGVFLMAFLLIACAVPEEVSITNEMESTIGELNQIALQIDGALEKDNIGDVRELLPAYADAAEKYDQLSKRYKTLVRGSADPDVKDELELIKQNRKIIRENVEEWSKTLEAYEDMIIILNAVLILTED